MGPENRVYVTNSPNNIYTTCMQTMFWVQEIWRHSQCQREEDTIKCVRQIGFMWILCNVINHIVSLCMHTRVCLKAFQRMQHIQRNRELKPHDVFRDTEYAFREPRAHNWPVGDLGWGDMEVKGNMQQERCQELGKALIRVGMCTLRNLVVSLPWYQKEWKRDIVKITRNLKEVKLTIA